MKKLLSFILIASSTMVVAQPGKKGKDPKMAAELVPGYYVPVKGDTIRGEIQTNPENEGDLYKTINFKAKGTPKVVVISSKKAKAYGYGDNHFMMYSVEGTDIYLRYLAKGRLNLLEYKYNTTVAGTATVLADYFVQDTKADEDNKDLRELKKLNEKFYKKDLKPYMKDQAMIWSDLDKFVFKPEAVANSVREYNRMYE